MNPSGPEHTRSPDHFSRVAAAYSAFRPRYPAALFDYLASVCPRREAAWDCACGSGQATLDLAARFTRVLATDLSAQQLAEAPADPRVTYRVASAEDSGVASSSIDLVTVAQALHWFDLPRFYAEVGRVLEPAGVLAAWTYGMLVVESEAVDTEIQHFYHDIVGPYWPPERRLVETGYRDLAFPFEERRSPSFAIEVRWTLEHLLGYVRSWSATGRYVAQHGSDPVIELERRVQPLWPAEQERIVRWPLALRVGAAP